MASNAHLSYFNIRNHDDSNRCRDVDRMKDWIVTVKMPTKVDWTAEDVKYFIEQTLNNVSVGYQSVSVEFAGGGF